MSSNQTVQFDFQLSHEANYIALPRRRVAQQIKHVPLTVDPRKKTPNEKSVFPCMGYALAPIKRQSRGSGPCDKLIRREGAQSGCWE